MEKEAIIKVVTVASFVIVVILLLWFMLGNTPPAELILGTFILPLYILLFGVYERLSLRISETRELLYKELGEVRQSLGRIEGKLKL
ncbi:MAG: hypothetical protein AABX13_02530 [Nanoarchaeota archaeon]